jgi:MFS family permease
MTPTTPHNAPSSPRAILGIVFITLFVDLVGFSIIFPLFPGMLEYYGGQEPPSGLFTWFYGALQGVTQSLGIAEDHWGIIVLFGGVLGSLYSLLQFICTPIFGAVSDRIGRKPVLLISLTGILLSYAMWFVARDFALLVASRVLSGIMTANISTATAIVADVTGTRERSKGMAIVGMAFGLGFILGPALGGMAAYVNLPEYLPALADYGVNPFSFAALIAMVLTAINLVFVALKLPETRGATPSQRIQRSINPLALFHTESYPGVSRTNLTYFLFLLAFSGMEFSLTFLAHDRLGYGPGYNALMFLFVGIVLAGIQGGYVRRQSERIGPRRMTLQGLVLVIPALILVGLAGHWRSSVLLYAGLFLLAVGAGQATPCLTALVSLYTPESEQGRILGIFRSLGALARAIGPLFAAGLYWWIGPTSAYVLGGLFVIVPLILAVQLPHTQPSEAETLQPEQA